MGSSPPRARAPAAGQVAVPYDAKVVIMFLSITRLYQFMHEVNDKRSSSFGPTERKKMSRQAATYAQEMATAVLNVCGTSTMQTYLHDAVYGMATLYLVLGKPYLGATEGNEHAHQTMKKYFKRMCSHSWKIAGDALQLMNLFHLREWAIAEFGEFAKPSVETAWRLGTQEVGIQRGQARADPDAAIALQDKALQALQGPAEGGREKA